MNNNNKHIETLPCKEIELFKEQLNLDNVEQAMLQHEQVECPEAHDFAEGVYVRTIMIPKDTLILGKRHRFETCNILLAGEISIYMGKGKPVKRLKAPCIFNSAPGVRKLGYTHKDTLFSNIHPTSKTDLKEIEEDFIVSEKEHIEQGGNKCLG